MPVLVPPQQATGIQLRHEQYSPFARLRLKTVARILGMSILLVYLFLFLITSHRQQQRAATEHQFLRPEQPPGHDAPLLMSTTEGNRDIPSNQGHVPSFTKTQQMVLQQQPHTHPYQENLVLDTSVPDDTTTIGYIISITGCPSNTTDPTNALAEGAAVLQHSIHLAHDQAAKNATKNKPIFQYKLYAVHHPDAAACVGPLSQLGYTLVERDTPVQVDDIQGDFLRERIRSNGCCGEKELIKLEAYTFTQHAVVVHVDVDVLLLQPLDELFHVLLANDDERQLKEAISKVEVMWPDKQIPPKVNALFTRDFGMVNPNREYKPVQGGFLVLRPNRTVYQEFVNIIKVGDYQERGGWGGQRVGPFYGGMTIQGLLPYYYDVLHPNESIDLNRCVYDQMCDNPRDGKTVDDQVSGKCRTGETDCEDCRSRPLEDIASVHYTVCQKPWNCLPHSMDRIQHRLCRTLHHEWYRVRSSLEQSWGRSGYGDSQWERDQFYGYCRRHGEKGYIPIALPYGTSEIVS